MRKRQIDLPHDHARLKEKFGIGKIGFLNLEEADLAILEEGTCAFLWESPLVSSLDEAADLARQAAADMTPAPERIILAAVLYVLADDACGLESIQSISDALQPVLSQAETIILGVGPCVENGIHFLLASAEEECGGNTMHHGKRRQLVRVNGGDACGKTGKTS